MKRRRGERAGRVLKHLLAGRISLVSGSANPVVRYEVEKNHAFSMGMPQGHAGSRLGLMYFVGERHGQVMHVSLGARIN
jgi:hypothetical protein